MTDGTGLAEAMLGLDGFRILEVVEDPSTPTATRDSRDPKSENDTSFRVATARSHPPTPHAHATPLPMSTCRQARP